MQSSQNLSIRYNLLDFASVSSIALYKSNEPKFNLLHLVEGVYDNLELAEMNNFKLETIVVIKSETQNSLIHQA